MVLYCKVPGCKNKVGSGVRLYRFPQNQDLIATLKEKLNITRRTWRPGKSDRICSEHFESGRPSWVRKQNLEKRRPKQPSSTVVESSDKNTPTTTIYRVDEYCTNLCQSLYKDATSESNFCDVTLKLNGCSKEYKSHSIILAISSPYLREILEKINEKDKIIIELPSQVEATGFEPILYYMYTGDLSICKANITAVYQVASLFQLSSALALCQKYQETFLSDKEDVSSSKDKEIADSLSKTSNSNAENAKTQCENISNSIENLLQPDASSDNMMEGKNKTDGEKFQSVITNINDDKLNNDDDSDDEFDDDFYMDDDDSNEENDESELDTQNLTNKIVSESQVEMNGNVSESQTAGLRRSLRNTAGKRKPRFMYSGKTAKLNIKATKPKLNKPRGRPRKKLPSKDESSDKQPSSPPPVMTDSTLSTIDPMLKFTDPAKYIAELINQNSDMLNDPNDTNAGGNVKVITRGKITYVYPEGNAEALTCVPDIPQNSAKNNSNPAPPLGDSGAKLKVDSNGLPFQKIVEPPACNECNMLFTDHASRDDHMKAQHDSHIAASKVVVFQCLNCSFSTDFLRNMWFHCHWKHSFQLPDTIKQYCCGLCDYRAPSQGNIEVHIRRVHTHERPLMCDVCGQFFKSLDTLRGHRFYRHQDIYPFQCNVCGKQFKRRHKLDVHMRIHMGYRPFACPDCPYATYTKFNLKDHMRKRHLKDVDGSQLFI